METIELKTAILHSLDMNLGMPVVSQVELEPTDFLNTYLEKRLQRLTGSEHCRTSTTASIGGVQLDEVLKASDWQVFYQFTLQLLEKLFNYRQSNGGQSADVLFALLEIDRHLSLYVGILDYRSSLIHHLSQDERQTRLELVEYQTTLPGASAGVSFEFCTDLFTGLTQLIEKKEKGFTPLSELLLNQQFEMTPKEKIKAAQKIVQEIHPSDDLTEMNRRVEFKQKVAESLQEKEEVNLEEVFEEIYVDDPSTLFEAKAKLQDRGLDQQRMVVTSSAYDAKLKKQKLVTDSGISIVLPIDYMHDQSHVEFITNPDGSLSILLKNIIHIYDK